MRTVCAAVVGFCLLAGMACAQSAAPAAPAEAAPDAKSQGAVTSYGIGRNIGRDLRGKGVALNFDALVQGIHDALNNAPSKYSDDQLRAAFEALQREMQAKDAQLGEKSKRDGEAFLAQNKAKPGVIALPDGLQYQVLKPGTGAGPKATDLVKVHYEGKLLDGTVFDSSIKRGQPAQFGVNQVIKGWTEALQLMKVGDKWRLFIPSDLAYGEQGMEGAIPPNSVLVFDVELLDVQPAAGK